MVKKYTVQGGIRNYMGQDVGGIVSDLPRKWKSASDHPETMLAYITHEEAALLVQANLHSSPVDKPPGSGHGPNRVPSYNGYGVYDADYVGGVNEGTLSTGGSTEGEAEAAAFADSYYSDDGGWNFGDQTGAAALAAQAPIRSIKNIFTDPIRGPPVNVPMRNIPQREADDRQMAISAGYIRPDGIADLIAYFKNIADKDRAKGRAIQGMGPDMVLDTVGKKPPSPVQFYYNQFGANPFTPKQAKEALGERTINELNKAIARNQAVSKGSPGLVKDVPFKPEGEVTWETPGYQQDFGGISDLFSDNPFFNLQNTLGQFYYGPANLAGEREIYDRYDWHKGDAEGLRGALETRDEKWIAETAAKAWQDFTGREGHPISFTVNPYEDQWKFNPETGEYIYPEGMGQGLYPWLPGS